MPTLKLDTLTELNAPLYRNICFDNFDEFDDLSSNAKARKFAHRFADFKDDMHYQAIDFIFTKTKWSASRFGNGKFPVWYGSSDLETSFFETIPHWHQTFIVAPINIEKFASTKTIPTMRRVYTVDCQAALIDLRRISEVDKQLLNTQDYAYTQNIGTKVHSQGIPGIISKSARHQVGDITCIFKKNVLSSPKHVRDYYYEYDVESKLVKVKESQLGKILLEWT